MHRLRLISPFKGWKKGDYPASPYIHLSVGTCGLTSEGDVLLSPQLMTTNEIDEAVDSMKMELEDFRKKAKQELGSIRSKISQSLMAE